MNNLKPPKNLRFVLPKVCANCDYELTHWENRGQDKVIYCARELPLMNPVAYGEEEHFTTCDRFKKYDPKSKYRHLHIRSDDNDSLYFEWTN